jgi:hypothetical protein
MILSVCCLVLAAGACSGDDDKDKDENDAKTADATPSIDPKEQRKRIARTTDCTAEASTTGAYEAEWGGKAQVRTGGKSAGDAGPRAVYTLNHRQNRVDLYSPGPEFKGSARVTVGDTVYSSDPNDAESLDIDKRGKSAKVEVTLTAIDGETVDLVADFACGKSKKKRQ